MSKGRRQMSHIQRQAGFDSDYAKAASAAMVPQAVIEPEHVRGDDEKQRRYRKAAKAHIVRKPHLDGLLSSAYVTAQAKLQEFEQKALQGSLQPEDLEAYKMVVDSLAKLAKIEQDQIKEERLDTLTQEELEKLVPEAATAVLSTKK